MIAFDDVVALGDKGSHLFKFGTNGLATDVSTASHLNDVSAIDGVLMDLDFTGKLDLVAVTGDTHSVRVYRQSVRWFSTISPPLRGSRLPWKMCTRWRWMIGIAIRSWM